MGQYYYPTIIRRKGKRNYSEQFYSHSYDHNGLKLMEHSYVGNYFTETVLGQLYNKPGRLAWMGDYHEKGDIENVELDKLFRRHYKTFKDESEKGKHYNHPEMLTQRKGRFILNHDKKVFIDMGKYEEEATKDEWGCMVHPLPILTAVGNGRGGGDFWNEEQYDSVGIWAGDLIETQDAKPNGYTDVTEDVFFTER